MNEMINTIVGAVLVPVLPILTAYIIALLKKKTAEINQSIENQTLQKYITIAEDAICTAVVSLNQVLVDAAKKSGQFDQQAQEEAFAQCKEIAISLMGGTARTALKEVYNDFDAWIDNKIQYYVNKEKQKKNSAVPTLNIDNIDTIKSTDYLNDKLVKIVEELND